VEVTERVYVDKPMRKQKEVPIERKQDVTMSLMHTNILTKVPSTNNTTATTSFVIGQEKQDFSQNSRGSVTPRDLARKSMITTTQPAPKASKDTNIA